MIFDLKKESYLQKVLSSSNPIILFGASSFGREMLSVFKQLNVKIKYFCDNDVNKHGKYVDTIEIISVKDLLSLSRDVNIIITSTYFKEIYSKLKEVGFKSIFCFSPWYTIQHYNKSLYNSIKNNMYNIEKVFQILEDDESKKVFKAILDYRLTFNINDFAKIVSEREMYFDASIIHLNNNEYFVDGGAYDGKSTLDFIDVVNEKFSAVYCFEPDKMNFNILKNNKSLLQHKSKVKFENNGLYKSTGKVYFSNNGTQGSCIDADKSKDLVNTISIDDYAVNNKITFIKMDIEGAEVDAINGGMRTLKSQKPKLAVCLYHKINDLWEIPLLIKSIQPEYKIYLRQYAYNLLDTVCYAI